MRAIILYILIIVYNESYSIIYIINSGAIIIIYIINSV